MKIDENQKIELFNKFYIWLKDDGLKPKRSERLHKKKIFESLLANNQMTLDNFNDFLEDTKIQDIKNLQNQTINYQNKFFIIDTVQINDEKKEFILKNIEQNLCINCKFIQIKEVKKLIV
jgi:uncharacterized protein (DUF1786 family)